MTTLKSQTEALEALKKSTTNMHNLIQGLINFSQVYPPLNWSVVLVNLCCWWLVVCWFDSMLTWCMLHNCTGWTIAWMWCELYGSGKCFVLLSDYVLAIRRHEVHATPYFVVWLCAGVTKASWTLFRGLWRFRFITNWGSVHVRASGRLILLGQF
jgi:hypothetical protein